MYTDGSVFNGPAGCGACAAVLNPLSTEDDIQCTSKAVGMKVSSVTCEIKGIIPGMVMVLQYFRRCSSRKFVEYLYILCGSSVAIDLIVQRYHHGFGYELFHRIRSMERELLEINVEIHLMWIPVHVGIELHDKADRLARLEARNIHLEISPAPHVLHHLLPSRTKHSYKLRPRRYDCSLNVKSDTRNFITRQLFKDVLVYINFLKTYFTLILYIVAFCQLFIKDMMDGWIAFITFDNAMNLSKDIAMKSWQQKWQREATGQLTRQFIPQVGTKILFPDCRQIGISYCRMLLNDNAAK